MASPDTGSGPPAGGAGDPPLPAACEEAPAPRHTSAPVLPIAVRPTLGGAAIRLGESQPLAAGAGVVQQLRFLVAQVLFTRAGQAPVEGQLVTAAGAPVPYNVVLVDMEKPDSLQFHVRAPAGDYQGLALRVGLSPACNDSDPARRVYPLNAGGGMTWTWTLGYVFFRLEGSLDAGGTRTARIAHGGKYPSGGPVRVAAAGAVRVAAGAPPLALEARMDDLFAIAAADHLIAGVALMEALSSADFLRLPAP
jgi:hypothetical protein